MKLDTVFREVEGKMEKFKAQDSEIQTEDVIENGLELLSN